MEHRKLRIYVIVALLFVGFGSTSASAADACSAHSYLLPDLAQVVPDWEQVNSSGFGDPGAGEVSALEAFNGYLYAGTHNPSDPGLLFDGARIFRSPDGGTWTPVTQPGFGNSHDTRPPAILDFIVFNSQLYASTGRGNASQIWRTQNGTTWAPMDVTGFSDPDNVDMTALAVFGGRIYAGVTNQVDGAQIYRSFTGDNNSWTKQVVPAVAGTETASITGFALFDGALWAAVESDAPAQIWRTYGGDWTAVVSDGFGDSQTTMTGGMAVFAGYLYVGAGHAVDGAQLWRTSNGTSWNQVINPGFGNPDNQQLELVYVFQNQLYVSVNNTSTGMEVWRSTDGINWEQVNLDGFGDSHNTASNWSNATANFLGQLFVGTVNTSDGGELWRMQAGQMQQERAFLPVIIR